MLIRWPQQGGVTSVVVDNVWWFDQCMWRVPKSPCPQVSTSQCKERRRRRRTFGTGRVKKNMEDVQRNPKKKG
jgi:hypothetical protein